MSGGWGNVWEWDPVGPFGTPWGPFVADSRAYTDHSRSRSQYSLLLLGQSTSRISTFRTIYFQIWPQRGLSGEVFAEGSAPWSKPSLEIPKVGFLGRCLPKAAPPGRNRAWIGPQGAQGAPWTTILDPKIRILDPKNTKMPILVNFAKLDTPSRGQKMQKCKFW